MVAGMKLVLFDCDGTLVDSQHQHIACMTAAYQAAGRPVPTRQQMLTVVGLSLPQCFDYLHGPDLRGDGPLMVEAYKDHHHDIRISGNGVGPLFDGLIPVLTWLHERDDILLGVATGNSRKGLADVLHTHGLEDKFVVLKTADDALSKPHPDMILQAMAETGVVRQDTVMIGDTTHDLNMAKAAEVAGIGVSYGYHHKEQLLGVAPRAVCDTAHEMGREVSSWLDERTGETSVA